MHQMSMLLLNPHIISNLQSACQSVLTICPQYVSADFGRNIATSASAHNVSSSFIIDISSRSMLAVFIISYCKKIRMIHRSYINDTATIVAVKNGVILDMYLGTVHTDICIADRIINRPTPVNLGLTELMAWWLVRWLVVGGLWWCMSEDERVPRTQIMARR